MSINNINDIRLVIHVEGGVIQAIYSNSSANIRVAIQNFDIEGADQDEIAVLKDGTEFLGHIENTLLNDAHVADVFSAFDESISSVDELQRDYIARNGQFCPNCGSSNIEAKVALEADGLVVWGRVGCSACESTWNDQYVLAGFSDLDTKPLQIIRSESERGYWKLDQGWVFDVGSASRFPSSSESLENWTFKPISSGNDAELVDLDSAEDFLATEYNVGDEVFWNDPDQGLRSGIYRICTIRTENGKLLYGSDVCFLNNEAGSKAGVLAIELS